MSGGVLGVAGDILTVAFLCFICSLAVQLYCAFSRRATSRPPTPLPGSTRLPAPPQSPPAASKQIHVSRLQRSASCPVVSAIAPPSLPPNQLSSAYHASPAGCSIIFSPSNLSPLACSDAPQAHVAALAKLMQLERAQEQDVDAENFICIQPQRQLFTIKEEGKDGDDIAAEQSDVAGGTSAEESSTESMCAVEREGQAKWTSTTWAQAPAAGLVSQVSSASSEGGWVSVWSTSSPCASSPAVSYRSASSSPFPTSSPPRSSFWAHNSRFSNATS